MYFTDRGIEELADRRGEEEVSLAWLADRLRACSTPAAVTRVAAEIAAALADTYEPVLAAVDRLTGRGSEW